MLRFKEADAYFPVKLDEDGDGRRMIVSRKKKMVSGSLELDAAMARILLPFRRFFSFLNRLPSLSGRLTCSDFEMLSKQIAARPRLFSSRIIGRNSHI